MLCYATQYYLWGPFLSMLRIPSTEIGQIPRVHARKLSITYFVNLIYRIAISVRLQPFLTTYVPTHNTHLTLTKKNVTDT
jgi:hypothetical protein